MNKAPEKRNVDFAAAKELSVSDFLSRQLGCELRQFGSGFRLSTCPYCGDSESATGKLSFSKDDRHFKCWSCGKRGSILDAAVQLWRCTLVEAAEQLLGIRDEFRTVQPKVDPLVDVAVVAAQTALKRRAFTLIQQLSADFKNEATPLDYLVNDRKLPVSIVREAQARGMLGFLPADSRKAKAALLSVVGEDLLRSSGLWKPDKKLPGIAYRPIVFFMPNLSSAEFRLALKDVPPDWNKSIRYGTIEYPYWWQGSEPQCMIVEGAIDVLSAVALGFKGHIMGLTGCNTFIESWFPAAAKRHSLKRFAISLDNDVGRAKNPGQMWAANIKELLDSQGLPCCIKAPAAGDINDVLKAKAQQLT